MENDKGKKILMKGKDIVQTNYSLKPVENKIFQLVLYNNQKQKHNGVCECEIPVPDFECIIGNKSERSLKEVEAKLKTIMKKSLTFYNSKIKGEYQLISGYEVIEERNSINVIMLERVVEIMQQYQENKKKLSPYAPINLSLFFELRSFYSQKLYDELRLWSRHNKEIKHIFTLEEIRFVTGTENKYPRWSNFAQKVLDVACEEINQKAKMSVIYEAKKVRNVVKKVEFTITDYEPHIYFSNNGLIKSLDEIKKINISKLEESFRVYIDEQIRDIESILFNNSSEEDRANIEAKISKLMNEIKNKINEFNLSGEIVIEECIDISDGALKLFKNDFKNIDFNDNDYYMILIEAFAKTIDKTNCKEITSDKNYRYFKPVLKRDIETFEAQKNLEHICDNEEVLETKDEIIEEVNEYEEIDNSSKPKEIYNEDITLENVKAMLEPIRDIVGDVSYKCWIESGIKGIFLDGSTIKIICSNSFSKEMLIKKYSIYINEIITGFFNELTEVEYIDNGA